MKGAQQVPPVQFQQSGVTGNQQVYNVQVAVPSQFASFWSQFWNWLLVAWKSPTLYSNGHHLNGVTAYGLLTLFTTLTMTLRMMLDGWIGFTGFLSALIGLGFIYFAVIFGGFIVKNVVYQDKAYTFLKSFDWFGRLFAIPVLLMGVASVFTFLNLNTVVMLLSGISYVIVIGATQYTLYHAVNHSTLDLFYKYLLATVIYAIILIIFFMVGGMIAGEVLFNNLSNDLTSLFDNLSYSSYYGY